MQQKRHRKLRPALDTDALERLALHYVARYATTGGKLTSYLQRKVQERGWTEDSAPDYSAILARCVERGYIDDAAFAQARVATLMRRGLGTRRISGALRNAGVDHAVAQLVLPDEAGALAAADAYARRKRVGAFSPEKRDAATRARQLAAMLRAGHPYDLARRIIFAEPETFPIRED